MVRLTCTELLGVSVVLSGELTLYAVFLLTPPALFLVFLLWKLRSAIRILREAPIGVRLFRSSALAFLWLICFVNILRVAIQVLIPPSLSPVWKTSWLLMRFMLMFCQVAVAAFIFLLIFYDISFEHIISSLRMDRLTRRLLKLVFISSTIISIIDTVIQALLLFAFDEAIYSTETTDEEGAIYWIIRGIVFVVIYVGLILLLHLFPLNPGISISETKSYWWYGTKIFHAYCWLLLIFNAMELLGWIFILTNISAGECVIGLQIFLYYSLFPPLVYLVFMAKFFQTGEHWPLNINSISLSDDESSNNEECDPAQKRRLERHRDLQRWMATQELEAQRRQNDKANNESNDDSLSYSLPTFPASPARK